MMQPVVAIVGRPNVGKSTLINRIAASNRAIVDAEPGVTRDRNYVQADWRGKAFMLVDTGGLDFSKSKDMVEEVAKQALVAVGQADAIIFLVDGKEGLLPDDHEIASVLRESGKPTLLVTNKIDSLGSEREVYDFYKLGLGDPFKISALHGLGIGDLLDRIETLLPAVTVESPSAELQIAIVGRPNVGKSSLFNRLVGDERAIVDEVPGTTRDAIDTIVELSGEKYRFVDTAGLKKRSKVAQDVDYYGFLRTLRALGQADIALVVWDGQEALTKEDLRITSLALERGCASLILLNKQDLMDKKNLDDLVSNIRRRAKFLNYVPVRAISALAGFGLDELLASVEEIKSSYRKRISTARLNNFIGEFIARGHEITRGGKKLKISYATQAETQPPVFVFFANHPEIVDLSYRRFLEKSLREAFGFTGCPIRIKFKKK